MKLFLIMLMLFASTSWATPQEMNIEQRRWEQKCHGWLAMTFKRFKLSRCSNYDYNTKP